MQIGYYRTYTVEQKYGLESQMEQLEAIGVEKIFKEQVLQIRNFFTASLRLLLPQSIKEELRVSIIPRRHTVFWRLCMWGSQTPKDMRQSILWF